MSTFIGNVPQLFTYENMREKLVTTLEERNYPPILYQVPVEKCTRSVSSGKGSTAPTTKEFEKKQSRLTKVGGKLENID
jgi:hypothetical protein